jgi:hypothetical protein
VKQRRFGPNIPGYLILAALSFVFYRWPSFIDAKGATAAGSITEKREPVRANFGEWFRHFEIVAAFRTPGSPLEHHAVCDVEQPIYDSLRLGDPVTVHYFPAILQQPWIPSAHLSPCTPGANFGSRPDLYLRLQLIFGSLLAILFLWLVLRIRTAGWLLVPWFGLFIVYCVVPRAEPAPSRPRPAKAVVSSVSKVDEILASVEGGRHTGSAQPIKLDHPYLLVQLQFTPAGTSNPVVALDAVDLNSIAGLEPKRIVDIDYDAATPRIARIRGGTRNFPEQALHQLMVLYGALAAVLIALFMLIHLPRLFRAKSNS